MSQETLNDTKNKTLYTNISLREMSQSPDGKGSQTKSKVIMIAGKSGLPVAKKDHLGNLYIQNQSQDRLVPNQKADGQIDFENQMNLKNYLSQINQAQVNSN